MNISFIQQKSKEEDWIFKDNQAIIVPKAKDLCLKCEHKDRTRAKGVVILDTGHHLTSHPTDIIWSLPGI